MQSEIKNIIFDKNAEEMAAYLFPMKKSEMIETFKSVIVELCNQEDNKQDIIKDRLPFFLDITDRIVEEMKRLEK